MIYIEETNDAGQIVERKHAFSVVECKLVSKKYCAPGDDDMVYSRIVRTLCYTDSREKAWDLVKKLRGPIKEATGNNVCVRAPDGVLL